VPGSSKKTAPLPLGAGIQPPFTSFMSNAGMLRLPNLSSIWNVSAPTTMPGQLNVTAIVAVSPDQQISAGHRNTSPFVVQGR
jgi:hypothetical protein